MKFVKAAVASRVFVMVFARGTIVGKCPDTFCQYGIVGNYSSAVAKGSEIFARIEAESCGVAVYGNVGSTMRLCCVFKDKQVVPVCDVGNAGHCCSLAIKMDGYNGASAGGNGSFKLMGGDECVVVYVDQNWRQTGSQNGFCCSDESHGRENDFVAIFPLGAETPLGSEHEIEGVEAVGYADAMVAVAKGGKLLLECGCCVAVEVPTAFYNLLYSFRDCRLEAVCNLLYVKEFYHS